MWRAIIVGIVLRVSCVLSVQDANTLLFESNEEKVKPMETLQEASFLEIDYPDMYGPQPNPQLKDIGHATNCGPASHNFSLTWEPKKVNPSRGVKFYLDMVAATDFKSGTVKVSVFTGGSPDPFITDTLPLICAIIRQKFPKMKCPVTKGDHNKLNYSQSDLTALPPGSYRLRADIKNEKNEDFLCAELNVEIMQ